MSWLQKAPLDQGLPFILDDQRGRYKRTERCARCGMSHKTGNQWLTRVDAEGRARLPDRRRAPHNCPHRIPDAVAKLRCAAGDLLARDGLVTTRPRRRPHRHSGVLPPRRTTRTIGGRPAATDSS